VLSEDVDVEAVVVCSVVTVVEVEVVEVVVVDSVVEGVDSVLVDGVGVVLGVVTGVARSAGAENCSTLPKNFNFSLKGLPWYIARQIVWESEGHRFESWPSRQPLTRGYQHIQKNISSQKNASSPNWFAKRYIQKSQVLNDLIKSLTNWTLRLNWLHVEKCITIVTN